MIALRYRPPLPVLSTPNSIPSIMGGGELIERRRVINSAAVNADDPAAGERSSYN